MDERSNINFNVRGKGEGRGLNLKRDFLLVTKKILSRLNLGIGARWIFIREKVFSLYLQPNFILYGRFSQTPAPPATCSDTFFG